VAIRHTRGVLARLRRTLVSLAIAASTAVLVSGCATPQPPAAQAADQPPSREWQGRFLVSVQTLDPNVPADVSAGRFELVTRGDALRLALFSPFGQTLASARRDGDGIAVLELADGRRLQAGSLDELLQRALGHPLPIERLPQWLERRFEQVLARSPDGTPVEASDSGWRIRMDTRRWELERPQPTGRLRVLLLLDR